MPSRPDFSWGSGAKSRQGLLIACTHNREEMLPWWWLHYRTHNRWPVAFVDLGMSESAKAWCKERGELIELALSDDFITPKEEIPQQTVEKWNSCYGPGFWPQRKGWFKKPFAFLKTPYEKTLWLDTDCQVRAPLDALFAYADHPSGLAMIPDRSGPKDLERGLIVPGETLYNSGVMVFKRGCPLIQQWVEESFYNNKDYIGDQHVLVREIFKQRCAIAELPQKYNWHWMEGENHEAVILHWLGEKGKLFVHKQIELLEKHFALNLSMEQA